MSVCVTDPTLNDHQDSCCSVRLKRRDAIAVATLLTAWTLGIATTLAFGSLAHVALATVAGPLLFVLVWRGRASETWAAYSDELIWQWLLSAGRSPRRIVSAAGAVVLAFAGLYFLLCTASTGSGDIVFHAPQGGYSSITKDVLEHPRVDGTIQYESTPAGAGLLARRCLYFSVVTATTLGYGDYQPIGRVQWLVMLESACGVLLICLLTASMINGNRVAGDAVDHNAT